MKLTQTHAEILKFIIVGGINTLNYYVVYLLLLKLLHIEYMISHITGFLVAFVISYYLNCYFVYRVKPTWRKFISFPITGFLVAFVISYYLNCYFVYRVKPTWRKFISFPITQIVNVSLQTVLLYVFVSWLNLPAEIAPFAGLIITIPITFILSKWILKDSN
ncbi:TPA: GtrA family protein [Staphylococcus aureus]|nr:GtrA family protein [Staphylococcus aureus]